MVSRLDYLNTSTALAEASGFAHQIIRPAQSGSGSSHSTVRHEHYHWGSSPGWGYYPQPAYCGPSIGGSSQSERKNDHSWVAIPAAIIALGTMYFIGQNHAEWSQAKAGMAKLQQKNRVVKDEINNAHPALKSSVQAVFQKQMAILDHIRSNAATGLLLKGILFASVIATGVGGLASGGYFFAATLEPLLGYGCASSFLTGCAMLYRAGFSSMDTVLQEEGRELQIAVNQAAGVLNEVVRT